MATIMQHTRKGRERVQKQPMGCALHAHKAPHTCPEKLHFGLLSMKPAAGHIGFFFAPGLQRAPILKKMERLMAVWGTIEKQVPLVKGGSMFEIQMKGNQLKPI